MAKGGGAEREVSSLLSLWFTQGVRDDVFGRTDGSGGRFTARRKKGKDTAYQGGDVTFTDPIGEPLMLEWNCEVKSGYGSKKKIKDAEGNVVKKIQERWDVLDLIDSSQKETVIEAFWKQCKRDADLTNRIPVLIFRRNARKMLIAIDHKYFLHLQDFFNVPPSGTIFLQMMLMHIMPLSEFFKWIPDINISLGQFDKAGYNKPRVKLNRRK